MHVPLTLPQAFVAAFQPSAAFAAFHYTYRSLTFQKALTLQHNFGTWSLSFVVIQCVHTFVAQEGDPAAQTAMEEFHKPGFVEGWPVSFGVHLIQHQI